MADEGNGRIAKVEVDMLVNRFEDCQRVCRDWRTDMDKRVRGLERFQWMIIGAVVVINFIGVTIIIEAMRRLHP